MLLMPAVKDIIYGVDTSVVSGYIAKLYIDKTGSGNQNWIVPFLAKNGVYITLMISTIITTYNISLQIHHIMCLFHYVNKHTLLYVMFDNPFDNFTI